MLLLRKLMNQRKRLVIVTTVLNIVSVLLTLWWNLVLSEIVNAILGKRMVEGKTLLLAILLVCVSAIVNGELSYHSGLTCESMSHDLRMGYARHFIYRDIMNLEERNAGGELSKLQNEITEICDYLNNNLFLLINSGFRFILTFTWLLWLNPRLAIFINLPSLIITLYIRYSSKIIGSFTEQSQQAKAQMNQFTDTLLVMFPIIQIYSAGKLIMDKYDIKVNSWRKASIKEERTRAKLMSLSAILSCLPLLLLMLIGGRMVQKGITNIGILYVFINLSGNVSGVMMNMPGFIASFRRFSANLKRIELNIVLK